MGVPADCVFGADNVTVSALPSGFHVYGGYYNGPFANMTALRARFPAAYLISIATRLAGSSGADAADAEPGTLAGDQSGNFAAVEQFLKVYKGQRKPVVYTMGSWAGPLERYLDSRGVSRSSYYLWTAHYAGLHLCGPHSCGLGASEADGTQYATGYNDFNVFRGYVVDGHAPAPAPQPVPKPAPVPVTPGVYKLGDTDAETHGFVHDIQRQLNAWAKYCGFAPLLLDGQYGGKTYSAVRLFQEKRKQGLAVTGVVNPETEKYLKNPPGVVRKIVAVPKPVPKAKVPSGVPALKFGDSGKDVMTVQYQLVNCKLKGIPLIAIDGSFGPDTQSAVMNFQRIVKLPQDGVYGPSTAKALAKVAVG